MLMEILDDVKAKGYTIKQIIMDHDTLGAIITCTSFPKVHITYCGNYTAKAFLSDLTKLKSVKCKVIHYRVCTVARVYTHSVHHHVRHGYPMIS